MARRMSLFAVLVVLALAAAGYGALHYMTAVPGKPHRGALPPLTAEEAALAVSLKRHIATIAAREHNVAHYDELEKVARYIASALASLGYTVGRQEFLADGKPVRNIDVAVEPAGQRADPDVIVVGAHYDSVFGSPGANDNASGAAAVIELARLLRDLDGVGAKRIRLALFVNEEPPYFRTEAMGSLHYARALVRETMRSFRAHTAFPTIGGVAPGFIPGIAWSDHWAFAEHGFPAVMVTDTAPFRYPHYHRSSDTPDKVDAENVARVVKGIERVIRDFSR